MEKNELVGERPCLICKNTTYRFLFDGKDRLYLLPGEFKLYQCCSCGLILILPPLGETELGRYYPETYYSYESSKLVNAPRTFTEKLVYFLRHPIQALNCIGYSKILGQNRDLPSNAMSRVLDIGCGEGRYLLEKKQTGAQCFGVDINGNALTRLKEAAPEISTFCGNVWDAGYPGNFFDAINLSHVLEHVTQAERLLQEVWRILKPEGRVRVQVPNTLSLTFAIFRKWWIALDVPRHSQVFSFKNLEKMAKESGFEVACVRSIENSYDVIGSMVYLFNDLFNKKIELLRCKRIWNNELIKLLFFPYVFFVNAFKIGDTVEFILRKKA
ncbi:MAG TPA: class I SAM-dependent methyltransferase [Candidatus Omnitrophota bacterium]|nr:class I SAM-dependent methyltransferase [Candidatus Omnitrophota bacterium]